MAGLNDRLQTASPLATVLLATIALVLHSFDLLTIHTDWITVALLAIILLAPYAQRLERISVANVEMELRSEIDQARQQADERIERETNESEDEYSTDFYGRMDRIQALISEDPILAVSDIRSELYRHIWMFAEAEGITNRQLPTRTMLQRLENEGVLDPSVCSTITEVIRICNKAIHQGEIEQDEANDLAELGMEMIQHLHMSFHDQVVSPVETETITSEEVEDYREKQYKVTSVVPLVNEPRLQTRIVPQSGLDETLEGYHEYAEFLIGIEPIDADSQPSVTEKTG